VNNGYLAQLEEAGLSFSGMSPDRSLVEFVELPREVHPYYVGTQAHPEFRSRPHRAHPLFAGLIEAAVNRQRAERLIEVDAPLDAPLDPLDSLDAPAGASVDAPRFPSPDGAGADAVVAGGVRVDRGATAPA
jgi:hypothetical protein